MESVVPVLIQCIYISLLSYHENNMTIHKQSWIPIQPIGAEPLDHHLAFGRCVKGRVLGTRLVLVEKAFGGLGDI